MFFLAIVAVTMIIYYFQGKQIEIDIFESEDEDDNEEEPF